MCVTCGCGSDDVHIEGATHTHEHTHADGTTHRHPHSHDHGHDHDHDGAAAAAHVHEHLHTHADGTTHRHAHHHDHAHVHAALGTGAASVVTAPAPASRLVQVERDVLAKNDAHAQRNRRLLAERGVFALNLVSSPGSGKTTLLVRTIERLAGRLPVAVIEGDQQTSRDADRVRATGAPALQINTGKGCHLDAAMVETAIERLAPAPDSVLMIENVGNLVCPSAFDLGEAHKVVVLSVTEGEDKPLKYPDMFHAASLMLLNKVDLLPHLHFDVEACVTHARRVNPAIEVLPVSATRGDGLDAWIAWIERGAAAARQRRRDEVAQLQRRVAELEAQLARLAPRAAG
ncbi:hydrogenase nickel incorporation protein HypB [Azohydromonas sediminis]|uniref:hydrogenase nickel incorporation protein HypB n=1 Tax=Azohydromonas sediminis TaxID=2259674 RepID=UPI000E651044|nr:hydrogenase nickel incorporation protein HypB [Azohydromonas sediminis]